MGLHLENWKDTSVSSLSSNQFHTAADFDRPTPTETVFLSRRCGRLIRSAMMRIFLRAFSRLKWSPQPTRKERYFRQALAMLYPKSILEFRVKIKSILIIHFFVYFFQYFLCIVNKKCDRLSEILKIKAENR